MTVTQHQLRGLANIANLAVDRGATALRGLTNPWQEPKGESDLQTEGDALVEGEIRRYLATQTPDIAFLGEEYGLSRSGSMLRWVLDPVDGTVNYSRGHPLYAISLALTQGARTLLGITHMPRLDERFFTMAGAGTAVNGKRVKVRSQQHLKQSLVCLDDYSPDGEQSSLRSAIYKQMERRSLRVRIHGSATADLCWLSAGITDCVVMLSNRPWDTAAGALMVSEAGGVLRTITGDAYSSSSTSLVATTPALLPEVLETLRVVQQTQPSAANETPN